MKTCPNCNYENNDTNNFCTECGTKLETPPVRCPKCETELTNQSKFCHNCGTKLTEDSEETPISSLFGFFGRLQKHLLTMTKTTMMITTTSTGITMK